MKHICTPLLGLIVVALMVPLSNSSAALLLEYTFNDNPTGSTVTNTGSLSGNNMTMLNSSGVATNLHSADMLGVSGLAGDYAFDNTASTGMGSAFVGGVTATSGSTSALASLMSTTTTGWFKTADTTQLSEGARLFGYGVYETYGAPTVYGPGRILTTVNGKNAVSPPGKFSANTESWVFFAAVFDGTKETNNFSFYLGTTADAVSLVSTSTVANTTTPSTSSPLALGNNTSRNRPFDGYLDNIRFFGSTTNDTGVLNLTSLEFIRSQDVLGHPIPEPGTLGFLGLAGLLLAGSRRRLRKMSRA